jgi:anthranilate phosphoribosyltransferase
MGRPTVFNNLGPLCNPAGATHQVIGVWDGTRLDLTAKVLARLGTKASWVVHGDNGLDEISLGTTYTAKVDGNNITATMISPADFGAVARNGDNLRTNSAAESAALIHRILDNLMIDSDAETLVLINAAAAIHVAGKASDLGEGFEMARESVRKGSALAKLNAVREATI